MISNKIRFNIANALLPSAIVEIESKIKSQFNRLGLYSFLKVLKSKLLQ